MAWSAPTSGKGPSHPLGKTHLARLKATIEFANQHHGECTHSEIVGASKPQSISGRSCCSWPKQALKGEA